MEELGTEMDSTSNRLDFVQVIMLLLLNINSETITCFNHRFNPANF